jgi:hypothetical protein
VYLVGYIDGVKKAINCMTLKLETSMIQKMRLAMIGGEIVGSALGGQSRKIDSDLEG